MTVVTGRGGLREVFTDGGLPAPAMIVTDIVGRSGRVAPTTVIPMTRRFRIGMLVAFLLTATGCTNGAGRPPDSSPVSSPSIPSTTVTVSSTSAFPSVSPGEPAGASSGGLPTSAEPPTPSVDPPTESVDSPSASAGLPQGPPGRVTQTSDFPSASGFPITPTSTGSPSTGSSSEQPIGGPAMSTAPATTAATLTTVPTVSTVPAVPSPPTTATPTPTPTPTEPALSTVGVAGVNVPGCRSQQRPVILLHGSFSTTASNFSALAPALTASGRCVYAIDYGNGGVSAIRSSASDLSDLVSKVRRLTGAATVDLVGYSQGGLVLRTALTFDGIANEVTTAVLIAPSWNGTTSSLARSVPGRLCPACADQVAGSPLLRSLDAVPNPDGGVHYAEISTRRDTVVTPISAQVPSGPVSRVRSVVLEDRCPALVTDHVQLPAQPAVIAWTVSALNTDGRPDRDALTC